jgi:hypothetical protein
MEIESVEEALTEILAAATNIVELVSRADSLVAKTREAALAVMGEELDGYDLTPRAPSFPPDEEEREAEQAGEEEDTGEEEKSESPPSGDEAAAAEEPAEAAAEEPAEAAAEDLPAPAPEGPETAAQPPPPDEPELVVLLRDVLSDARTVATCAKTAARVAVSARAARDEAVQQSDAAAVAGKTSVFETQSAELATLESEALQALERAAAAAEKAQVISAEVLRQRAEQQRLETERQKEEARLQLAAREKALAEARDEDLRPVIAAGNYQEAIETVRREIDGYQTEEAKDILRALMDRYKYLAGLRSFLIERLNTEPYSWGWVRAGGASEDVLGADENTVRLRGRRVPWNQVAIPQYIRFIEHYLSDAKVKKGVRARQYLAAAVYCYENGGPDYAAAYVRKALDLAPYLREESERVLPLPSDR